MIYIVTDAVVTAIVLYVKKEYNVKMMNMHVCSNWKQKITVSVKWMQNSAEPSRSDFTFAQVTFPKTVKILKFQIPENLL